MQPRIIYRDDAKFPWWIIYGFDKVWAQYRARKGAERDLKRLMDLLSTCSERRC